MNPSLRQWLGASLFGIMLGGTSTRADLIHRFSFNDGVARDSVGAIAVKLVGDGAQIEGGQLRLKNDEAAQPSKISYLELSDSVLPRGGTTVSIVVWFTAKDVGSFARILNFGESDGSEGRQFIYFSPHTADGSSRAAITGSDVTSKTNLDFEQLDDGKPHMVVIVIDGSAKKLRVYADGRETKPAEDLGANTLNTVKPAQNWLGKSSFSADPGLAGSIDELRVYDHALTLADAAAAYEAGPDKLPEAPKSKTAK